MQKKTLKRLFSGAAAGAALFVGLNIADLQAQTQTSGAQAAPIVTTADAAAQRIASFVDSNFATGGNAAPMTDAVEAAANATGNVREGQIMYARLQQTYKKKIGTLPAAQQGAAAANIINIVLVNTTGTQDAIANSTDPKMQAAKKFLQQLKAEETAYNKIANPPSPRLSDMRTNTTAPTLQRQVTQPSLQQPQGVAPTRQFNAEAFGQGPGVEDPAYPGVLNDNRARTLYIMTDLVATRMPAQNAQMVRNSLKSLRTLVTAVERQYPDGVPNTPQAGQDQVLKETLALAADLAKFVLNSGYYQDAKAQASQMQVMREGNRNIDRDLVTISDSRVLNGPQFPPRGNTNNTYRP